jgi:hypothetical protein
MLCHFLLRVNERFHHLGLRYHSQLGFYKHLILTKKNFIHLVLAWQAASNNQSPFLLLYQDEHNWYGIVPFDSQKAMEEFIISNTKTLLKK